MDYVYHLDCAASAAGVSVEVLHERWESDRLGWAGDPDAIDDFQNSSTQTLSYGAAGGNKDRTLRVALPITTDDDTDANYEMYQKVKFRVTSGAVTGTWSTPNLSAAQKILGVARRPWTGEGRNCRPRNATGRPSSGVLWVPPSTLP